MPTWSPTDHGQFVAITSGNSIATRSSTTGNAYYLTRSDLAQTSGVRYVEFAILEVGDGAFVPMDVGVCNGVAVVNNYTGNDNNALGYRPSGALIKNALQVGSTTAYTTGDIIGMLVDFTARTVKFRKNGAAFSSAIDVTSLGSDLFACCSLENGATFSSVQLNAVSSYPAGSSAWTDTPLFPGAALNIVAHGDSISLTSTVQRTYLPRLAALIQANGVGVASWTRCGINGASWNYAWPSAGYPSTLIEDAVLRVDPARVVSLDNWLICFAGTNGLLSTLGAHSAATEYANFQTYIAARIAAGQDMAKTIACMMLPRTGMSEATRTTYNASLVSGAATYGYKLARLDLNPNIGAAGQNLDLTWFQDGTHPTDAGHAVIAQIIFDVMGLAVARGGGGTHYTNIGRHRTDEDIRKAREKFGVIPKKVAKVIATVAKDHVEESDDSATDALIAALDAKTLVFRERYAEALLAKIARIHEEEETALALLLH